MSLPRQAIERKSNRPRWRRRLLVVVGLVASGFFLAYGSLQAQPVLTPVNLHAPDLEETALFGSAVEAADVNGDGRSDVIVGAPRSSGDGLGGTGDVFVFLSPGLESVISLRDMVSEASALFGASVAAGDVDGDGTADVIVGAPGSSVEGLESAGKVFVFFGPDLNTVVSLHDASPEAVAYFGVSVAAGDIDRDGKADVIVGAHLSDVAGEGDAGEVLVFSGAVQEDATVLSEDVPQGGAHFGFSVAAGDVNGDGNVDVIVGAEGSDLGAEKDAGEAFVFLAPDLADLLPLQDPLPEASAQFGKSVAAGDINGDGTAEVIVGAKGSDVDGSVAAGEVFVFLGDEVIAVRDPNPETIAWFGFSLATGDIDGDGRDEVIVGSTDSNVEGAANAGQVFVILGPALTGAITLDDPTPETRGHFGVSVAAGDLNGDGAAEVIGGAHYADVAGVENAGEVFVFSAEEPTAMTTPASPTAATPVTPRLTETAAEGPTPGLTGTPAATATPKDGATNWRLWGFVIGAAGFLAVAGGVVWWMRTRSRS